MHESDDSPAAPQDDAVPGNAADNVGLPYFNPIGSSRLVTLCHMPPMEAEMARAKLESVGIPCNVANAAMATIHPLLMPEAKLLVREADLENAREVLNTPAEDDGEGDYADEEYRCPQCYRKQIDLLPLGEGWRIVRTMFFIGLIAPVALWLLQLAVPVPQLIRFLETAWEDTAVWWILATIILGAVWMLARRTKKCRACGCQWTKAGQRQA